MNNNYAPFDYSDLYNSVMVLFRYTKRYIDDNIYEIHHFNTKRLLDACYMVLHTERESNILLSSKSIDTLMDDVIKLYNSNTNMYNIFEKRFNEIRLSDCGFYPFYDKSTRIKYYYELKNFSIDDYLKVLIIDAINYMIEQDLTDYLYYYDYTDPENLFQDLTYNDDLEYYYISYDNFFYNTLDTLFEEVNSNLIYKDMELFKLEPDYNKKSERLNYIHWYIREDDRFYFLDDLNLTEKDLIDAGIEYNE